MASGTITFTASGYLQGKIDWSSKSNGSVANTSSVTAKLYAKRTNSYTTKGQSWSGFVKVGSTQKNIDFDKSVSVSSSWVLMAEVTATISHNDNGTGSVAISGSVKGPSGTALSGNTSKGSKTVTLDTIPRASVLGTISDFTLGNAIDIPITKRSSDFTDNLTISLNGTTIKTINGITNGYDVTFTTAELTTIYSKIPNGTTGTFTFNLTTKSGSVTIGTSSKTATGTIPSSVKPTISSVTISEGNTSVVPSSWGVYVKNKSKLKFVVSASGGSGSSVSKISTTIDGSTYNGSDVTTNLINTSGNLTATIVVTDSRGRTATTTKSVTIQDYDIPYINSLTAFRCDKDGNALDNGTYAKISLNAGVYSLSGKNTPTYSIKYKKTTESEYQTYTFDVTDSTINSSVILEGFETTSTYNVVASIGDYFTTTNENMHPPLMGVFRTINFLKGGKGGAIGKLAEKEGVFEFALKLLLTGGLEPIFLEADTDLNDVRTPNFYTGKNISSNNYANCPLTGGTFYLEVMSCGADGQVRQTITSCDKTKLITFTRFYYSDTWGEWIDNSLSYKNIVTVIGNGDTTLSTTEATDVKMKGSVILGTKLTNNSDGQVIIGPGVNYVKIEASLYAYSGFTNGDLVHLNILRNTSTVYSVMKRITGSYETIAGAGKIIAVSEGDVIKLCGRNQTGARGLISGSGNVTFMTVEAVG